MPTRGKNINLYLMDGTATGCIKCTLANWTGIAYKIPRTKLDDCKERAHLRQSGVYFLFGTAEDTGRDVVYVGQAGARKNGEGLLNRLQEHRRNPEKDYWREAVVFTTSNNSFGPTEISYLENRFCSLASEANRYEVKNGNEPSLGNITEEKESELEEFIDYAKVVMGTLGHKLFEPVNPPATSQPENSALESHTSVTLYLERTIKNVGRIEASGIQTAEGFVVLKGSHLSPIADDTVSSVLKQRRAQATIDKQGRLLVDELFSSPSSAATFITGKSSNGLVYWKTEDGRTLKALEAEASEE